MKPRILFVDDEPNVLASYGRILREHCEVVVAESGEAGLQAFESKGPFAVVISDFQMPRMDGIKFLAKVRERAPDTVRMMLTGEGGYEVAIHAVNEGNIFRLLTKPCPSEQLIMALDAGIAQFELVNAEKDARERELHIAFEIQKNLLLGKLPKELRGASIATKSIPSRGVDGDFTEFIDHTPLMVDIIIGDVMGKGIPAALIGAGVKSQFSHVLWRLYSQRTDRAIPEPEVIFQRIRDEISGNLETLGTFITSCYARFDMFERLCIFVDAGHPPTLHFSKKTGCCSELKGGFFPLGIPTEVPFRQSCVKFDPGDAFLFFSDGLMDCGKTRYKPFGIENIKRALIEFHEQSAEGIIRGLYNRVEEFVGSPNFGDDLTCIVVKIDEPR